MLERGRRAAPLILAALLAALAVGGAVIWLLDDGGDPESTAKLAQGRSPSEAAPPAPVAHAREGRGAPADRQAAGKREGEESEAPDRDRAASSKPARARQPELSGRPPRRVLEQLLGGGDPERGASQSELPPEISELLPDGDEPESSNQPEIKDILQGSVADDR